jgi:hypothetical protein
MGSIISRLFKKVMGRIVDIIGCSHVKCFGFLFLEKREDHIRKTRSNRVKNKRNRGILRSLSTEAEKIRRECPDIWHWHVNHGLPSVLFCISSQNARETGRLLNTNYFIASIVSRVCTHVSHIAKLNVELSPKNSFAFHFLLSCSIFFLKSLVAWYFQRKVNSNSEQLSELRTEKRELLDHVKTKETYKDAVEILQRFGGNDLSAISTPTRQPSSSPENASKMMVNTSTNMTPSLAAFKTPAGRQLMNVNRNISTLQQRMNAHTPINQMDPNRTMIVPSSVAVIRGMKRTPYPIIDSSQKSVVDKMVDYIIGDGPANRFAMICQQCFKHNGKSQTHIRVENKRILFCLRKNSFHYFTQLSFSMYYVLMNHRHGASRGVRICSVSLCIL